MTDLIKNLTTDLQQKIDAYVPQIEVRNIGTVTEAGDGIAQVEGLAGVRSQELVQFENRVIGIAFNLEKDRVGVTVVGDYTTVSEGMQSVRPTDCIGSGWRRTHRTGGQCAGEPIDGKGPVTHTHYRPSSESRPAWSSGRMWIHRFRRGSKPSTR